MATANVDVSPANEIADFLLSQPTPRQMIDFKLSRQSTRNVTKLLKKNREGTLSHEERVDLDGYVRLETLIGLLKARAWDRIENKE